MVERVGVGTERLGAQIDGEGGTLVGVGIGMIGPLDHRAGVVRDAYALKGWADVPLRELAEAGLGIPVLLDKDVTAAASGQAWALGHEADDTALILIEAGVGAGLWLRDAAYRGAHTNAGEFGHAVVDLHGPHCRCGRDGCLEAVHEAALDEGDVEAAAHAIAVGALNLVETLDVRHVVLGGTDFLRHEREYLDAVGGADRAPPPRQLLARGHHLPRLPRRALRRRRGRRPGPAALLLRPGGRGRGGKLGGPGHAGQAVARQYTWPPESSLTARPSRSSRVRAPPTSTGLRSSDIATPAAVQSWV